MEFHELFHIKRFRRSAAALMAALLILVSTGCASPDAGLPSQSPSTAWTEPSEPSEPTIPTEASAPTTVPAPSEPTSEPTETTEPTIPETDPPATEPPQTEVATEASETPAPTDPPEPHAPTQAPETEPPTESEGDIREYVLNTNTKKFHLPECKDVGRIKDKNRRDYTGTREDLLSEGYSPCGHCHP